MDKNSSKIAIACFAGAVVGALIALEIANNFWFIGIFLGALVGYLAYNVSDIPKAVKTMKKPFSLRKFYTSESEKTLFKKYMSEGFIFLCISHA